MDGVSDDVWQVFVPHEALKFDYLMNGILSMAAMHLATDECTKPAEYIKLGSQHQDSAFTSFRASLNNIDRDNRHAMFAFSIIAMTFAIASAQEGSGDSHSIRPTDIVWILFKFVQG